MNATEILLAYPLVGELLDAACDEAEIAFIDNDKLEPILADFDLSRLSAAVERSRVTEPPAYEGNVYDFLCEGGSESDAYDEVVMSDPEFAYVDSFLSRCIS
jgi:hypothetical protein